jgi:sigma-B regulation protein RsbU (phosphoserine phosphatase)
MTIDRRGDDRRAQERRHGERVMLAPPLPARIGEAEVTLVDLGMRGARVQSARPIAIDGRATLRFQWQDEEIALDCNVVRSDLHPQRDAAPPAIFESGVQFVHDEETARRFTRLIDTLAEREEIEHLKVLIEASKLINSSIEADQLFASILTVARKELGVERGTLYFVDEARREIWAKVAEQAAEIRLPFGRGLAGTVAATGQEIILHDAYADSRFDRSQDARTGFRTRSMLCVPIRNKQSKVVGVLQLLNKVHGSFGEKDLRFLAAISDHMAIAMENAQLHIEIVEKQRMERELQLGREIQSRLMPAPPVDVRDTRLAAMSLPCYEVGGDYYDFIELPDGDLGVAIGDVSGKGVSAALIMSSVQAALRMAAPIEPDLPRLVTRLNGLLFRMAGGRKYVTFFFGRLNPATGELRYVNAGHNPPFVCTDDGVTQLPSTGRPIGILPESSYEEATVTLPPGSTLLLYTDGLNEAENRDEQEFGMERLTALVREACTYSAEEVPRQVLDAVLAHENGAHANDDKTLVVVRRA